MTLSTIIKDKATYHILTIKATQASFIKSIKMVKANLFIQMGTNMMGNGRIIQGMVMESLSMPRKTATMAIQKKDIGRIINL